MSVEDLAHNEKLLFEKIFSGSESESGAFRIPEIEPFLNEVDIRKIKASSDEKVDIKMQIHDVNTGFSPIVGFSVKSDVGNPPTLLNSEKIPVLSTG